MAGGDFRHLNGANNVSDAEMAPLKNGYLIKDHHHPNNHVEIDFTYHELTKELQAASNGNKFPKEPSKLFFAFLLFLTATTSNDVVLALIHEWVPSTRPLPDLFFAHLPNWPWALDVSEWCMIACASLCLLCSWLHKYRWIVYRRLFFLLAVLYSIRAVCMLVTQVPVANPDYFCSPKLNETAPFSLVMRRSVQLISGFGMALAGKHTYCGDYIYSGHTVVLVFTYLMVAEYSPRRFWWLHWATWFASGSGVVCLLLSRGHYSIDVIIAYFITTRVFWMFHTLANHSELREPTSANHLSKVFWFRLFCYMEGQVAGPLPRDYDWPLCWPNSRCLRGLRSRRS